MCRKNLTFSVGLFGLGAGLMISCCIGSCWISLCLAAACVGGGICLMNRR